MEQRKQIEAIARIICKPTANKGNCERCGFHKQCSKFDDAANLYNAGYGSRRDTARELFAEIDQLLSVNSDGEATLDITALHRLQQKYVKE